MEGKICMVTGGTAGIGLVTARELAERGATVIVVGRNAQKGERVVRELKAQTGNQWIAFQHADLSRQEEVKRLARQFVEEHPRLDVLVNNAGAIYHERQVSAEGIEMTLALNHLNYFLLTGLLLDRLRAAAPARIVNVASRAHENARLDIADLQSTRDYGGWRAYCNSKLANILFTFGLARRLQAEAITVNALHPGFVRSDFGHNNGPFFRLAMKIAMLGAISVEAGAATSIHLATAPELAGVTGRYFVRQQLAASSPASRDAALGDALWRESEALTGFRYGSAL
jgi:retinol dehydrogenase 12